MRISKRQLRRIIREEKRKMQEGCGDVDAPVDVVDIAAPALEPALVAETGGAEGDLVVEMEIASRALDQVVESVQNAAQLCPECAGHVAAQAPIMEAMVAQAEALQEMLDAQTQLVSESAGDDVDVEVIDVPLESL